MPNKKNALKALRQTKKRTLLRTQAKSRLDALLRSIQKSAVAKKVESAPETLRALQKTLDKASKNHLISRARANRLKSRLNLKLK